MNKENTLKRFDMLTTVLLLIACLLPAPSFAQMREFEQNMSKLQIKLPPSIFDGTSLSISTYEELQQIKQFGVNYNSFLQKAITSWEQLGRGQNQERREKLMTHQAYLNALVKAYKMKEQEIQRPIDIKPVTAKAITLQEIYIGPDVSKDQPVLLDTLGQYDTLVQAYGHPGTKAKPTRWSAQLRFYVKYQDIAPDDTIMIEVFKDDKSLGKPTSCQSKPAYTLTEAHLAYYQCEAPSDRDFDKLFTTSGTHTIKLTYKKPIEGIEFKDFASLRLQVIEAKQGAANSPSLKWQTDHDMKLAVSTIEEEIPHSTPSDGGIRSAIELAYQKNEAAVTIRTWFKKDKGYHPTKIACLYNGKRIDEAEGMKGSEYSSWTYLKQGSPEREDAQWTQYYYQLFALHPRPNPDGSKGSYSQPQFYLNENPGEYRCVITGDGDVMKELFFTVGPDGHLVKPACQLQSMNTLHTVTLLASKEHQLSTVPYDKDIGKKWGYEGRVTWQNGCPPTK